MSSGRANVASARSNCLGARQSLRQARGTFFSGAASLRSAQGYNRIVTIRAGAMDIRAEKVRPPVHPTFSVSPPTPGTSPDPDVEWPLPSLIFVSSGRPKTFLVINSPFESKLVVVCDDARLLWLGRHN
eukprot:scaffold112153_cov35-Prasinocladus_malaysianus.AAC.3